MFLNCWIDLNTIWHKCSLVFWLVQNMATRRLVGFREYHKILLLNYADLTVKMAQICGKPRELKIERKWPESSRILDFILG